jgi:spore coat polysaccharide biosynthesis protein SpsF (cytidylyltransferase family)
MPSDSHLHQTPPHSIPLHATAQTSAIAVIDLGDFSESDVQPSSARFAPRKLGGLPLVIRMARRLSECALIDGVYVTGSNVPSTFLTSGIAGVQSINLPTAHICERLAAAADASDAEWIVCVPGNRPFVDATLIDQLLASATKSSNLDYVGFASNDSDCQRIEQLGLAGEVIHSDTLRRLRRNADRLPVNDRCSIATWLGNAPGAYHLTFLPLPPALERDDLRFSIEDELDWDDVELLCETLSAQDSQWQELTQLVIPNDDLRTSMATRNS